jgi:hypothetical protein
MPETRTSQRKVPVTLKALMARINRRLRHEGRCGELLKTARSEGVERDLGRYYLVDLDRNSVTRRDVDPEELGRELGALKQWEELAREVE